MIYVNAFIFCGIVCAIGQLVIEYTNLTPGHLNAILVVVGAVLSFFGLYDIFLEWAGAGASVPITNFGHILYKGAFNGLQENGITGFLNGILANCSGGLSVAIVSAFVVALFCKPRD